MSRLCLTEGEVLHMLGGPLRILHPHSMPFDNPAMLSSREHAYREKAFYLRTRVNPQQPLSTVNPSAGLQGWFAEPLWHFDSTSAPPRCAVSVAWALTVDEGLPPTHHPSARPDLSGSRDGLPCLTLSSPPCPFRILFQ